MAPENREKGPDEVYCSSCGNPIKQRAELCPNCGVQNENQMSGLRARTESTPSSSRHDLSEFETTVSDSWWYGVAAGLGVWMFALILAVTAGESVGSLVGLFVLVAWVGLPLAAYFDIQYVRANGEWDPNTFLWLLLLILWFVNVAAGVAYLYRRHEVLGEP